MKNPEKLLSPDSKKSGSTLSVVPNAASDIEKAAQILKNGGVVIFPTDTVYGIGCIYNNKEALGKIYKIKNRPQNLPFPILVSSISQAKSIVRMNEHAKDLAKKYWPGGLTIILPPCHPESRPGGTKDLKTHKIGVRMPDSKITLSLIEKAGSPIVGTSANFHGQKSVSDYQSLDPKLLRLADFAIEGKCQKGRESTVVDTTGVRMKIIRQGAVKLPITN